MSQLSVADLRRRAGLTQQELASLSGVAQPNIAAYEKGTRNPSAQMLERLAAAAKPRPSKVLDRHREAIRALAARHKALDVKVFGSVARGEDRPGSDLDLLVTFRPDASLFDLTGLAEDVEELTGIHVDVISDGGLHEGHDEIRAQAIAL